MIAYDEVGKDPSEQNKQMPEYAASLEDKKLIKKLNQKFYKAKKKREKYDDKWADRYRFFRGQQWKFKRPSYRHSEVINLVFKAIQSFVPILTDARPRFEFLPQDPTDREFAEIISEVSEADWVRNNWNNILVEVVYEQHIFGTGLSTLYFDQEKDDKQGAACFESVDPFTFFPNPEAKDTYRDCDDITTAQPRALDWIKKKYPEKGKFVKPDMVDFEYLERSEQGDSQFKSPTNGVQYEQEKKGDRPSGDNQNAVVFTACFYDDETEESNEPSFDENGLEIAQQAPKLKYPEGRKVVWAGEVILEDKPLAYEQFPYQKVQNYVLPREFWGMSEIEQIEGPQAIYNKIYSFALDVLTLMGNPIWVIDNNSQVNQDALVNKPGLVVTKVAGTEVRREQGVQLQPYVLQILDMVKNEIDGQTGATEVSQGVRPAGIMAADAIRALQEAAQTRMRLKSRLIDCYLQTMGQQYLDIVMRYYTIPKIYRITGKDGAQKYFKFSVDEIQDENGNVSKVANVRNYQQNEENGQYFEGEEKSIPIKGKLDVRVITGTSLPFARAEKESKILSYFEKGLIDQEETLKALDYPNYEALLARMQEKQEMMAGMPPL